MWGRILSRVGVGSSVGYGLVYWGLSGKNGIECDDKNMIDEKQEKKVDTLPVGDVCVRSLVIVSNTSEVNASYYVPKDAWLVVKNAFSDDQITHAASQAAHVLHNCDVQSVDVPNRAVKITLDNPSSSGNPVNLFFKDSLHIF